MYVCVYINISPMLKYYSSIIVFLLNQSGAVFTVILLLSHKLRLFEGWKSTQTTLTFQTLEMRHFFLSSYLFDGFKQRPENFHDCSPKPAVSYGERMISILQIDLELESVV